MRTTVRALPVHLEGYDVFAALAAWSAAGPDGQHRHWTVRQWGRDLVMCTLTWWFGDGQLAGFDKSAVDVREAVWLVLDEFASWDRAYSKVPTNSGEGGEP